MARPIKEGLDYFPIDVNIFDDDKIQLLIAEFGVRAFYIFIKLLCKIYGDKGYYMDYNDDYCLILSQIGGLGDKTYISEVIKGAVRRGLFDDRTYMCSSILTSRAIQNRYFSAVLPVRKSVKVVQDYLLIEDELMAMAKKYNREISYQEVNLPINSINSPINSINSPINTQSKVKQSKVKQSKVKNNTNIALTLTDNSNNTNAENVQFLRESGFTEEQIRKYYPEEVL